jgi:hypothetical protein
MIMKLKQICIVMGIMFVTALAFGQPSSLLVCRGGGNLNLEYKKSSITIKFKKGTKGADENWKGISAGECSFEDRAVDASEPDTIKWKNVDFSVSWTGKKEPKIRPELINVLRNPNKYQSFHVTDDGRGNFQVEKIGDSRPK